MLSHTFSHLAVVLLWLLHLLPLPVLAIIGLGLGRLFYYIAERRRKIALVNLTLCFPTLGEHERTRLAKASFQILGRSILERGILWWGNRERILRLIKVIGEEKLYALHKAARPVILLAPHFAGLDVGAIAVAMRFDGVTIYAAQRNKVFERVVLKGRRRFGNTLMLSRQEGARATIKAMKSGRLLYYLPDMNFRRRDSIFVPFFGIQAATITGLSRLSKAAGAAVVPCITRILPGGEGYRVEIGDAWTDFPTGDVVADTARMNAWIESVILAMPEQYYWVHRRFKTRPPGEPGFY